MCAWSTTKGCCGSSRRREGPDGAASGRRQIAVVSGIDAPATNVVCAVAVALELGVAPEVIAARLPTLASAPHRREVSEAQSGARVIDDTYNSNPAGAAGALLLLERLSGTLGGGGKRVVVTPGMVELGERQFEENRRFGASAAAVATHLLMVGHTNAVALRAGWTSVAEADRAQLLRCATRDHAVRWVAQNLGPGDVVLYENDLPDHHP